MKLENLGDIPVGALVIGRRTRRCVEPCTMLGIKAEFGNAERPRHMISVFWLGSENAHPGFDEAFNGELLMISESFRLSCNLDTCEFFETIHDSFAQACYGLHVSTSPIITGEVFNANGNAIGGCICTPGGTLKKFDVEQTPRHRIARFSEWLAAPSEKFDFGWLEKPNKIHRAF